MMIEIPVLPEPDWKRKYVEAITTTTYPTEYKRWDHKGGDISGYMVQRLREKLAEKEAQG